ncbi:MAG TPA: hypothetical protein VLW65_01585 [Bryobacteraceae bacterium]|nr:hypothetical protein [Bryobacteraceae bacterium]
MAAEFADALIFFDCAAVVALSLRLVTQEDGPHVGTGDHALEALSEGEVAVLRVGNFDVAIAHEFGVHDEGEVAAAVAEFVHGAGAEAGFEAVGPEDGLLGDGHAVKGRHLLRVGGAVDGDEIGLESGDFVEVFETDDGKSGAGVFGRSGGLSGRGSGGRFAFRREFRGGFRGAGHGQSFRLQAYHESAEKKREKGGKMLMRREMGFGGGGE